MTLLTGALALLALGLMLFLAHGWSDKESFASPDSTSPVTRTQLESPRTDPVPVPSEGVSEECPEDESSASVSPLETQLSGNESDNPGLETEASGPDAADILRDLGLPEGLSLSIAGTGETCK